MALSDMLAQVKQRESGGNYTLTPQQNYAYPTSHASGAYQFQPGTWQLWTARSGVGTQYPEAYLAPPEVQDQVAMYAAQNGPGINSPALWGASSGKQPFVLPSNPNTNAPATTPTAQDIGAAFQTHLAALQQENQNLQLQQQMVNQRNKQLMFGLQDPTTTFLAQAGKALSGMAV